MKRALLLSAFLLFDCHAANASPTSTAVAAQMFFLQCAMGQKDGCVKFEAATTMLTPETRKLHFAKLCYKYGSMQACSIMKRL